MRREILKHLHHRFFQLLFVLLRLIRQRIGRHGAPDQFFRGGIKLCRLPACLPGCSRCWWWRFHPRNRAKTSRRQNCYRKFQSWAVCELEPNADNEASPPSGSRDQPLDVSRESTASLMRSVQSGSASTLSQEYVLYWEKSMR